MLRNKRAQTEVICSCNGGTASVSIALLVQGRTEPWVYIGSRKVSVSRRHTPGGRYLYGLLRPTWRATGQRHPIDGTYKWSLALHTDGIPPYPLASGTAHRVLFGLDLVPFERVARLAIGRMAPFGK